MRMASCTSPTRARTPSASRSCKRFYDDSLRRYTASNGVNGFLHHLSAWAVNSVEDGNGSMDGFALRWVAMGQWKGTGMGDAR